MFDIVLFEPEIPPNTGNVIRLAANTGCRLHLVRPYGFRLSERAVRRAGLDYHGIASVTQHRDWLACRRYFDGRRMYALTTSGLRTYAEAAFARDDVFLFGSETRGLPQQVLAGFPEPMRLRLPMNPASRSLNLANAVAVTIYEAWRQHGFDGGR